MFHPRRLRAFLVITACATLSLLLLTTPHSKTTRAAAQSAQSVPVGVGDAYIQTNLMSDVPGLAQFLDPIVVNTWGISRDAPASVPTLVHTGTGTSTFYGGEAPVRASGSSFISPIPGTPPVAVANNPVNPFEQENFFLISDGTGIGRAFLIFASPAGEITAWAPDLPDQRRARLVLTAPGHKYTGATIASNSPNATAPGRYLYAADFANGKIDVYNRSFVLQTSGFPFTDPTVPPDFHPYNIENSGNDTLYVTYARPIGPDSTPQKGPGLGYVRVFNADGVPMPGGMSQGELNAPWGVTFAPSDFGVASNRLLVANTGDGRIIGQGIGPLLDASGNPIVIEGLHGLAIEVSRICCFIIPSTTLLFTAGPSDGSHGLFGRIRSNHETITSSIQFSAASYSASEADGHVDITVTRTGDTTGAATVNYNTTDESAAGQGAQKPGYVISLGTLNFAPGETSKTFRVLIINDNLVEGAEKVGLALSNVKGAGAGLGSDAATLTILDNDTTPSTANPIDETEFFVRQHYLEFLNREPDTSGFNFWVNQIESCGTGAEAAQCREVKRVNVSAAFFLSIEFRNTGLLAYLTNKAAFGFFALGAPVFHGQFVRDVQLLQRDFVFGQPGADAVLEANKQAYFAYTVARPDFTVHPMNLAPVQYVDELFRNTGVTPTKAERDAATNEFGGASDTTDQAARARALRRVVETGAFASAEFNRAFVTMEYFGYLRRDLDAAGFNFWLSKLNQFNGDFQKAEMVKAFISSDEYRHRFGN